MMSTSLSLQICWLCICGIATATGSLITFTASPGVLDTVTNHVTLHCGLNDTATSASRQGRRSVTQTSADLPFVTSVVISKNGKHVASVSQFAPATTVADVNSTHVSGAVSSSSGERAFLEVTFDFPTQDETGQYLCQVHGADRLGRPLTLEDTVRVNWTAPTVDQLAKDLRDLVKLVDLKDQDIKQLQAEKDTIMTKLTQKDHEINTIMTKLTEKDSEISSIMTNLTAAKNVESGLLSCGPDSKHWTGQAGSDHYHDVSGTFSTVYDSPPVVHLSVVDYKYYQNHAGTQASDFTVSLVSVDRQGFTARCQTLGTVDGYFILQMSVSWLSLPH